MMNFIRRNTKYFLWTLAIVFIIGVFFWNFSFKQYDYVAKVNGTKIPYVYFRRVYERELFNIRDKMDEELTESIKESVKQEVLRRLIYDAIFIQEAKKHKIKVSPTEIAYFLHSQPEFQHEGKFSRQRYYAVLRYLRTDPSMYEARIRQELAVQKLNRIISSGIKVTDLELKESYELKHQGDMGKFEEEKESFKESLLQEKRMMLFNRWLGNLRKKYKIIIKLDEIEKQIARFEQQ